ncbi:MAG: PQQ-binding-like beta-propeller repeat protein [Verrucomicrobiota bacterium]
MNRRLAQGMILAAWLGATALAQTADWPQLGGPNGAGVSPERGFARAWPTNGPKVAWSIPLGDGYAGAAVRDALVYVLDRAGEAQDVLRCLDLATGREHWQLALDAPGKLPFHGSRNVPTVDAERVYAVGPFGQVYCVNRSTHQLEWQHHLLAEFKDPQVDRAAAATNRLDALARTQLPMWGMTQAPLIYQDVVIVAPQTAKVGLVAYDKVTGKERWRSAYIGRNWYSHVSPYLTRLCGVEQIIMLAQPSDPEKYPPAIVSAVEPSTGRILWQTKTPGPHKIPMAQPLRLGEDRLFITGGYRLGCALLQVSHEREQWATKVVLHNKEVAGHIHSPILYRDHVYVLSFKEHGATNTGLVCLNLQGQVQWQTGPDLRFDNGALLLVDDLALVMQGKTGELHLFEVNPAGFKLLARVNLFDGGSPWAPMALSDGKLLLRNLHELKCLELPKQ